VVDIVQPLALPRQPFQVFGFHPLLELGVRADGQVLFLFSDGHEEVFIGQRLGLEYFIDLLQPVLIIDLKPGTAGDSGRKQVGPGEQSIRRKQSPHRMAGENVESRRPVVAVDERDQLFAEEFQGQVGRHRLGASLLIGSGNISIFKAGQADDDHFRDLHAPGKELYGPHAVGEAGEPVEVIQNRVFCVGGFISGRKMNRDGQIRVEHFRWKSDRLPDHDIGAARLAKGRRSREQCGHKKNEK